MPPSEFSLRLQHGIAGGFAPPLPSAIYTLTAPRDQNELRISSAIRPDDSTQLQDAMPKTLSLSKSNQLLVDELHRILKSLPTEQPPGSEDIYGLNTSIAWGSDDLMWVNGGPSGCDGGPSSVQPTAEQKANFKRAVDIVTQLVKDAN